MDLRFYNGNRSPKLSEARSGFFWSPRDSVFEKRSRRTVGITAYLDTRVFSSYYIQNVGR